MDLGLARKRVIVTGGARGIGYAICETFAREGADVALCARSAAGVKDAVGRLEAHGTLVVGASVDATEEHAYTAWLRSAVEQLGGLDVFVHNISGSGGPPQSGEAAWSRFLDLDVLGLVRAEGIVLPAFEAAGGGSVVCLSSIAAQEDFSGQASPFGAMKAALAAYAGMLARTLASRNVRVNLVSPGPVLFDEGNWGNAKREMSNRYTNTLENMPIGRLGAPQEIANIVAFLASPAASFVTGTNVTADGAYTKRFDF